MKRNTLLALLGAALGGLALYWSMKPRRRAAVETTGERPPADTPLDERPTEVRAGEGDPHAMIMETGGGDGSGAGRSRH